MSLPKWFKKVSHKVAGKYSYDGDLIITNCVIYYFPHTDLLQMRINTAAHLASSMAGGHLGGALVELLGGVLKHPYEEVSKPSDVKSFFSEKTDTKERELSLAKDYNSLVQEGLDALIARIREDLAKQPFSSSFPPPSRHELSEIKKLGIGFKGSLLIETSYDMYEYKVGYTAKKELREALEQNGFAL